MRVLTLGTFDILHYGHIDFLRACADLGELTVGVNSDMFASTFKEAPIMNEEERMYTIQALGYKAVLNSSAGRVCIKEQAPDILAVGSDWAVRDYHTQIDMAQGHLDEMGISLIYIPRTIWKPMSTTEIKRRVRKGQNVVTPIHPDD